MKPYIAFFDLDNTLLSGSSGRYLVRYSYKNGLLSHSELVNGIYSSLLYRAGFTDSGEIVGRWIMKYRGWPERRSAISARGFRTCSYPCSPEAGRPSNFIAQWR